jgi:hypothetical protein
LLLRRRSLRLRLLPTTPTPMSLLLSLLSLLLLLRLWRRGRLLHPSHRIRHTIVFS